MTDPIKYINDMDWHRVRFRFSKKDGVVLSRPGLGIIASHGSAQLTGTT